MKILRIILSGLICLFYQTISLGSEIDPDSDYADFINKVQNYQKSVKLIHIKSDPCKAADIDTTTFDLNYYLSLFDKVGLAPEYKFYLYPSYGIDSGNLVLYAIHQSFDKETYCRKRVNHYTHFWDSVITVRINNFKRENLSEEIIIQRLKPWENMKKIDTSKKMAIGSFAMDSVNRAFNHIIPTDSGMGYLQYLFFYVMGEQFGFYWHSYYREKKIISSGINVQYFWNYYRNNSLFDCELKKLQELMNNDVAPSVLLKPSECLITWYEIETHRGVFKRTYSIDRRPPFKIRNISDEKVLTISPNFFY